MLRCEQDGCGWVAIAPSERAAWEQYEEHVLEEHVEKVDDDVPEGHVQVKTDDDEWVTLTPDEASDFYGED